MVANKVLIAGLLGALLAGCGDESSKKAEKSSSPSESQQASTTSAPAQAAQKKETDKIDEAIFALKFFSANERDKAAEEAKRILAEINTKVAELDGKADPAALQILKGESATAAAEIDKLAADSETVWWKVANAYAKTLLDHKRSYDKVAAAGEVAKTGG